jgi:hypothetical protein
VHHLLRLSNRKRFPYNSTMSWQSYVDDHLLAAGFMVRQLCNTFLLLFTVVHSFPHNCIFTQQPDPCKAALLGDEDCVTN